MTAIGLLSDTHSHMDDRIKAHLQDCDEIWHAGDIGTVKVADQLSRLAPLRGVYGNIDGPAIRRRYPQDLHFNCEGLSVYMTHIGGSPGKYRKRVQKQLAAYLPDMFICGHSHILKVERVKRFNNMIHVNPGAAGQQGMQQVRTLIRFVVRQSEVEDFRIIELENLKNN